MADDGVRWMSTGEAARRLGVTVRTLYRLIDEAELPAAAKEHGASLDLVREVAEKGKLPVVMFSAGGVATPADAALMMSLGAEGVFVGSGIFKSEDPERTAAAVVEATTHFADPVRVAAASRDLGTPMTGIGMDTIDQHGGVLSQRGW